MSVKRISAAALAAAVLFAALASCQTAQAPSVEDGSPPPVSEPVSVAPATPDEVPDVPAWQVFDPPAVPEVPGRPIAASGALTIGENTMNGDFVDGWTSLSGNGRVKELINGCQTVTLAADGRFTVNPTVVEALLVETNEDLSRTYTIRVRDDMKFSDGTPITARDYVFSLLWSYSPLMLRLGASAFPGGEIYRGALAYHRGASTSFEGLRLLGEFEFSITVDYQTIYYDDEGSVESVQQNFPFWYELTYALLCPMPMHIIAPGCEVEDSEDGTKITGNWNIELMHRTVDNGYSGYRYTPNVSAGPYRFVGYDTAGNVALLEANRYFPGDYEGYKPMIKTIIIRKVDPDEKVEQFIAGGVDMLIQAGGASGISSLMDHFAKGSSNYISYPRYGYGKLTFHVDEGPAQFPEVRRAVAYCLDREEACRIWTGGHGIVVSSRLAPAQWMYADNAELVDGLLNPYSADLEKAIEELVAGGWVLDEKGNDYVKGIRYKMMPDGSLMKLHLDWFAANNTVGAIVDQLIAGNFTKAGISYKYASSNDSQAFTDAVYGKSAVYYNMVSSAVNFAVMDSPWYYYDPDPAGFGIYNENFISDEHLYALTLEMKATEPGDYAAYFGRWLEFVSYFNEQVVDLPLYTDIYYDFFMPGLHNYSHSAAWPYTSALVRAWIGADETERG